MTQPFITPETLAAFLDGRLGATERAKVIGELNRDPDAYQSFVDAAALMSDLDQPLVIELGRWSRAKSWLGSQPRVIWISAAAMITALLLIPGTVSRPGRPGTFGLLETTAIFRSTGAGVVAGALGASWHQPPWPVTRGGSVDLDDTSRGFRAGVRVAELEIAWRAQDREAAALVMPKLHELFEGLEASGPITAEYQRLLDSEIVPTPRASRASAARLRAFLGQPIWFDLGMWAEQARWAARTDQTAFFEGRSLQELERIRSSLEAIDQPDIRETLRVVDQVGRVLEDGLSREELAPLLGHVETLMRTAGS